MSSNGGNNNIKNKQPSPVDQMVRNLASDSYAADGQYNQLGFAQPQPQTDLYNLPQAMHNGYNYLLPEQQEQPMYSNQNGHYVPQNYVLPQQNMFMNDNRYDKHTTNNDYNMYHQNLNYRPYLNFAADNSFVYETTPQQQYNNNVPPSANSNQFLENLSGHWSSSNNTGTYSPFGSSNLFDSDSKLPPHSHNLAEIPMNEIEIPANFNHQFGTVRDSSSTFGTTNAININVTGQQQQLPKKPRAIAEVKPMRPSYSDVLLKSAPTAGNSNNYKLNNKINDVKTKSNNKEKDASNNKKGIKTNDKLINKNSLNRSNTTTEIKDLPNTDKATQMKKTNLKPVVHHPLNRKWASLDNVTNDQQNHHDFNKPEPIETKLKPPKSTTPKSAKKNPPKSTFNDTNSANKQSNQSSTYQADSESSSSQQSTKNDNNGNCSVNNRPGGSIGARRGNSGGGIRVVRQRNYEQAEKEQRQQTGSKRGGHRGARGKRDCNMPLGLLGQYCRQYLTEWWKIVMRFVLWLYHLIFDICSMSTTITIDFLYSFRDWTLYQYASLVAFLNDVDQNPLLYLWNKVRRKKPIPDETTRTGTNAHVAGLHHNINMPTTGEEAMKRLLACKGKDPYSILGLTADCSDEDIRRYYRRQAFLVHPDKNQQPGAEEAFKILVHAFDMIGEQERREAYDRGVAESVQVEQAWSELTTLLAQLQAKVAAAANTIRCSSCSSRHKRTSLKPPRPVFAARWCAQCRIRHGAREGDIWAESISARIHNNNSAHSGNGAGGGNEGVHDGGDGMGVVGRWWTYATGGWRWRYYACMEGAIYDVTEWAACQKESLRHLKADQHSVQYRIALGKQQQTNTNASSAQPGGQANTSGSTSKRHHRNSSNANYSAQSGTTPDLEHLLNTLYGQTDGSSTKAGTTSSSNGTATGQDTGAAAPAQSAAQRKRRSKNK